MVMVVIITVVVVTIRYALDQGSAPFLLKGQTVDILGFANQMVSLATTVIPRCLQGIGSRTFCRYQNL